jgi:hypothetical protein
MVLDYGCLESCFDFDTVIVTSMNEEISCRQISEFIYSVWCETRVRFANI